ncbi:hypothetical protein BSKO_04471 [Bryopsis sp. KO-2023]|nr:hypothetical protein BSKO_04471 [Bryopsis sp. KO-2023]
MCDDGGTMHRDMTGMGRYPPQPKYPPFAMFSSARLGDPEQLAKIFATDPYFPTQDNGAGAPLHFAVTYRQLDMVHHLLNTGALVNQRDPKGLTPLHRAAYLAHYDGYLEIYELLLSRGADPSIQSEDYDTYLDPGRKLPCDLVSSDDVKIQVLALEKKYAATKKEPQPHPHVGCWWTLYDFGPDAVCKWPKDHKQVYPEDQKRQRDKEDKLAKKKERKERRREGRSGNKKKATPVAFLFPGQGSQMVGMLKESLHLPTVQDMLKKAQQILGYDLKKLCVDGPKEDLDNTVYSQPALFVAGLAAVEHAKELYQDSVESCSAAAGLSLGEYTALVFAGAMSFEDALKVVKVRAESMAKAAAEGKPHGMLSVVGLVDKDINELCDSARKELGENCVCQLANSLFPQGRVVSGHLDALEKVKEKATKMGALKAQNLAVSGAFHTKLMQPARKELERALKEVKFHDPRIPVYLNVTAEPLTKGSDIAEFLGRQLVEPVQWEETLKKLIQKGHSELHELGPNRQIKAMVKRIDAQVWKAFKNVPA